MGEAIISRYSGESEAIIPIIPGYHTLLVTLRDYNGDLLKDLYLNCKDGSTWYNYKTNEKGQVMYTCNSGSANITFPNNISNGLKILGLNQTVMNVDAPIGMTSKVNMNIPKGPEYYDLTATTNFMILNKECDINIVGGGGGGAGGGGRYPNASSFTAGAGGAGYMNNYNMRMNGIYRFIVGSGGSGGPANCYGQTSSGTYGYIYGGAGGTSYVENTNMSAVGGAGGGIGSGGVGGLGNGGFAGPGSIKYPENSPVDFAGGGGAQAEWMTTSGGITSVNGGSPYGGKSVHGSAPGAGSRGGGGGAPSYTSDLGTYYGGARGGDGMMRIKIHY